MLRRLQLPLAVLVSFCIVSACGAQGLRAKELRITVPRYSKLTPVQQLNREGVEAARKHQTEKAQALFFKAYLFDPSDPFTLNNLGYAAELQGDADGANKFYALAEKQDCDAVIELSSLDQLRGKPMLYALQDLKDAPLRLNRMNVQAIELLTQNRGFEATLLLARTLVLDPHNSFTLNNLGVAKELTGDLESAAEHYRAAAEAHSTDAIIVSPQRSWRGKPISDLAAGSLKRVEEQLREQGPGKARATMLAFRGVTAINGNDWQTAKQDFLQAYTLDPTSAFSLNNLGYVAEKDGDLETADFYYRKARRAEDAKTPVGLASGPAAEGQPLAAVASDSSGKVGTELDRFSKAQRSVDQAPELVPRGTGAEAPASAPSSPQAPASLPPATDVPVQPQQ